MSFESILADVGGDVKKFASTVAADWKKVKAAWSIIASPQVRAIALQVTGDVIQTVEDSETAVTGGLVNVTLDEKVVTDIKNLIADAKADDGVVLADLKALGVVFSTTTKAVPVTGTVQSVGVVTVKPMGL